ncbi:MAG: VCBS repeat-containing protein [Saprospiraceae bacterium]
MKNNHQKYPSLYFLILLANLLLWSSCQQTQTKTTFRLLPAAQTGVQFANEITETDSFNILMTEFIYNGGGVAIGDLNGDGLEDLFFTGNQVDNQLYINQGKLTFINASALAGIQKTNPAQWSSGANILDINLDGKLDIYVCNTLDENPDNRRNLLYVNQGNNAEGIPSFLEMGKAYGVDDPSHSSHAQFFDYDNDGDLDLFVGVNLIEDRYPNQFVDIKLDGTGLNRDNLFQNNWDETLGHPVFTDVSLAAGLLQDGYSHSTLILDINEDGWQDIYVANDYQSDDLIFINNQDGTFTNQAGKIFKHFSLSAMGSDVADINNDGAADFFTTEMQPYYNKRKKLFQGESSYQMQILTERYGYNYQYTRNTLQLNQGTNPTTGLPVFAEIGMYAEVQETDWSWAPLFADYDNDGWKDLYVANGFPRDVTDRDFGDFRAFAKNLVTTKELYERIPEVKSPNFLFRNKGDLSFENVTKKWGLDIPSFTNGAAYADLDNDGDLDLVTNNIGDKAFVFENTLNHLDQVASGKNYLRVQLKGAAKNPDAFGASAEIRYQGKRQKIYLLSGRGYLSKSENTLHFGLGDLPSVDTLLINWPDGLQSIMTNVVANQRLEVSHSTAQAPFLKKTHSAAFFASVAKDYQLLYKNQELDFIDFNFQRTLPHKFSQYGPSIAVGDANGDGLDDIFLGGSRTFQENWMWQQADGQFKTELVSYKTDAEAREEDTASLLFDADGDGDNDLYIVRGSAQSEQGSILYQDVLYVNDGKGGFTLSADALPEMKANGSCVKAADFDGDGDLDLFVGSRVLPRGYPLPDRSFLLRNDSQPGRVKFTDITAETNEALLRPGLISDALWTDINGDQWPDLILAGEWMPITIFENKNGKTLVDITTNSGLADDKGWWNSLAAADLDQDGDMDYIAGNFGENLYFRCTSDQPIRVYGKDLDANGMIDPLISCYWQDSLGNKNEYLYHPRPDLIKQFVGIRKKFNTYGEYGEATVSDMFTPEEMADAMILSANWMKTVVIENKGNGRFEAKALPIAAQLAPVYGILPYDIDQDGQMDLLLVGNDHGIEVQQGRADAFNGLALLNKGNFDFHPLSIAESNFMVKGDAIGVTQLLSGRNQELIVATQNRDSLQVFTLQRTAEKQFIPLKTTELKAIYYLQNGRTRAEEFYWGSSFMSQKGRYVVKTDAVSKIEVLTRTGEISRVIE